MLPLLRGDPMQLLEYFVAEAGFRSCRKAVGVSSDWRYIENRDQLRDLPRRELQKIGGEEEGGLKDQFSAHAKEGRAMKCFLEEWEERNARGTPTLRRDGVSQSEREQLEAVGYFGDNDR